MHVIVDYRPALRARTGIGEYVHELVHALDASRSGGEQLTLFSSSWRDRLPAAVLDDDVPGATRVDCRVPVGALTWAWHRVGWPPIEALAGACDVVHSPTPLLVPARRAAQVVTVFDLHFLYAPDDARGPARHHFPTLVRDHVRRADHVIAGSTHAEQLVHHALGVPAERVTAAPLGAPRWASEVRAARGDRLGNTLLFVGTLEPRKNLGVLLDAYAALVDMRPDTPRLVLAGQPTDASAAWRTRAAAPPLAGRVDMPGYVDEPTRRRLYRDARALLLPSLDEGFGLTALEAMACGVPVVASTAGSLPEVVGDGGLLVDPHDVDGWTHALATLLDDDAARAAASRGFARAAHYRWSATAEATRRAYAAAVAARRERS